MNKAQSIKLFEVTSQRQADNGTVCFFDPIAECYYMSYENGYVRRKYRGVDFFSGKKVDRIYQLNPQKKVKRNVRYSNILYTFSNTKRIMILDPEERLELIYRAAINYRNTLKKRNND